MLACARREQEVDPTEPMIDHPIDYVQHLITTQPPAVGVWQDRARHNERTALQSVLSAQSTASSRAMLFPAATCAAGRMVQSTEAAAMDASQKKALYSGVGGYAGMGNGIKLAREKTKTHVAQKHRKTATWLAGLRGSGMCGVIDM